MLRTRTKLQFTLLLMGVALTLSWAQAKPKNAKGTKTTSADKLKLNHTIPMWTRVPTKLFKKNRRHARNQFQAVKVTGNMLKELQVYDAQYRKKMRYMAISLPQLLRRYKRTSAVNMALMHFSNKTVIPYPLRLMTQTARFPIHIAFARWSKSARKWSRTFPPLSRLPNKLYRDMRPIRFAGNKLVVTSNWHPLYAHAPKGKFPVLKGFKVWKHIESLKYIEFVHEASYYRQFDIQVPKDPQVKKGYQLYKQVCQFCHGVRKVGAGFGWDFVSPYPVYRHRQGMSLFYHIKYRSATAQAQGIMMPAVKGMKTHHAFALWYWLRAVARNPLRPYAPPTTSSITK